MKNLVWFNLLSGHVRSVNSSDDKKKKNEENSQEISTLATIFWNAVGLSVVFNLMLMKNVGNREKHIHIENYKLASDD